MKNFSIEKDPSNLGQHDPGEKFDEGKPDASLLIDFKRALMAVAQVGTFGSKKYSRVGWQYVEDGYNRYTASMIRHLLAEEEIDKDSGLDHDYHIAWNALARLELKLLKQNETKRKNSK